MNGKALQSESPNTISDIDIEERNTWDALQKLAAKQSHARECGAGVQSLCVFFEVKQLIQHRMPVQLPFSHNDLNQEEVTPMALATDHKFVQWMITCTTMNHRFVQWVTLSPNEIRGFVPWVTTRFLHQKRKNQRKNHLNQ